MLKFNSFQFRSFALESFFELLEFLPLRITALGCRHAASFCFVEPQTVQGYGLAWHREPPFSPRETAEG